MKLNEYKCEECGGVFEKGMTEEEARKEQVSNGWGDKPDKEMAIVCDDCYQEIMKGKC